MIRRTALLAATTLLIAPSAVWAEAETRFSAEVGASVGYSHSPFAIAAGNGDSGFGEVRFNPVFTILTERNQFRITGNANHREYFSRYSSSDSYGGGLDYRGTPSANVTTHAAINYDSSIIGAYDAFQNLADPNNPIPINPNGPDIGLFGTRDRVDTFQASGDFGASLNARDSINGNAYVTTSRYSRIGSFGDYNGVGGGLGYSRAFSENTKAGVRGSIGNYHYLGPRGDSRTYSIQLTGETKLNARWSLEGAAGITLTNDDDVPGTLVSFSGNVTLCDKGDKTTFCLNALRDVRPTGFAGTQNQTSFNASYTYALSERSSLTATASYVDIGQSKGTVTIPGQSNRYASTSLGYNRQVTQRLALTTSVFYRDTFGGTVSRPSDYGGQIGLSYRLGDLR